MSRLLLPVSIEEEGFRGPPQDPSWAKRKTFVAIAYWRRDAEKNVRRQIEDQGGLFIAVIEVPSYNYVGQKGRGHYAVIYQHTEEIGVCVAC